MTVDLKFDGVYKRYRIKQAETASRSAMGFVQRIRSRFRTIVLDVAALRRLGDVARPLLMSLDDEQKQKALQIAHTMGMSSLASVF